MPPLEYASTLEIENAVNRCHRRCRIVNVREKTAVQMQYVAFVPYEPLIPYVGISDEPDLPGTNWLFNLFRRKK
jgi:hypothetical protein